jgi:hypothetical protein
VLDLLAELLEPGMELIDAGAFLGYFTLAAAARVGARGRVWAFEPCAASRRLLERSVSRNRLANVTVVPLALGVSPGSLRAGSRPCICWPAPAEPDTITPGGERLFCPQCGAEYQQGITECADCEVALVAAPPAVDHPEPDLVQVAEISEPTLLPVVVGLLQSAGIEPLVEGDEVMGVLPVGQFGGGVWSGTGHGLSVVVKVPRGRAEEAETLLREAEEVSDGDDGEEE